MRMISKVAPFAAITIALASLVSAADLPRVAPAIAQLAKLRDVGVSEEVMLAYVQNASVPKPNAEELIYLHEHGVSTAVVTSLLKRKDAPVASPEPTPVYEETPSAPTTAAVQQPNPQPIIIQSEPAAVQSPTVIHIPARGYTPRYNESYFAPYFGAPYFGSSYFAPTFSIGVGVGHFGHHRGHFGHHGGHHHYRHHGHHGHHWTGHRGNRH